MDEFAHIEDYDNIKHIMKDIQRIKIELVEIKSILQCIQQKQEVDDARKRNEYIRKGVPIPFHPEYTSYIYKFSKDNVPPKYP